MLIRSLCDYAMLQDSSDIPEGWQEQPIHFRILLTHDGDIRDIVDVREYSEPLSQNGKKKNKPKAVPRKILLPLRSQKTAINSNIIEHRALYIFGLEYDSKNSCYISETDEPRKKHAAYVKSETEFFDGLDSPVCMAYRKFIEKWNPDDMTEYPALKRIEKEYKNSYFGFALGLGHDNLEDDEQFKSRYRDYLTEKEECEAAGISGMCGVLGEKLPIARIHDKISSFPGGQSSGCVLVGMKENAYESYGKTQSYNSNISEKAMKMYTQAFNRMLADRSHHKLIGDLVVIYFAIKTNDSDECDWFSSLFDPDEKNEAQIELDSLMSLARSGRINNLPENGMDGDTTFYIAGMTPNSTRICQKFIVRDRFGNIIANLAKHQYDMRIGTNDRQISFRRIERELITPESKDETAPPPLMTSVILSAINGTRYPDGLLAAVVRRIKADRDKENNHYIKLNDTRAGIIKAYLNRKTNKEEIGMAWDETNTHPAYLCGGLFAIYEKIQQDASESKLNRTIKDAFFASACSRPASVMPKLDKLSANHIRNIRRKNEGTAVFYQNLIGSLMSGLNGVFPQTLSLDDQGRFIIGYYHMNKKLWTSKSNEQKG